MKVIRIVVGVVGSFRASLALALLAICSLQARSQTLYTDLDDAAQSPSDVEEFSLVGKKLKAIPPEVFRMRTIRILDLSSNEIDTIPADIARLQSLEELYLGGNMLRGLPDELFRCMSLRVLDVTSNRLDSLTEKIGALTELRELRVAVNGFRSLPSSLARCTKLEVLSISGNALKGIPSCLGRLPSLTTLRMNDCAVTSDHANELYSLLCALPRLKRLTLAKNFLTVFPSSLLSHQTLRHVDLRSNFIERLPDWNRVTCSWSSINLRWNHIDTNEVDAMRFVFPEMDIRAIPQAVTAKRCLEKADSYRDERDYQTTYWLYQRAFLYDSTNLYARYSHALACQAQRRYHEAILHFHHLVDTVPTIPDTYHEIARCYNFLGQSDSARAWCERAITIDSTFAESYRLLGIIELKAGNEDATARWIERCLHFEPKDAGLCSYLAGYYSEHGNRQGAYELYERALDLDPKNGTSYFYYAVLLYEDDDERNAYAMMCRAADLGCKEAVEFLNARDSDE